MLQSGVSVFFPLATEASSKAQSAQTLAPRSLNEQCGRGVCFDVMIGRLALGHETAARALADSSLSANA
jgi:hypothetical protein